MCNVIFIFGPSCSGKSTLAKALQKSLGREWTYIDRDDLIEQKLCTESAADIALDDRIQTIKKNIIIDAQVPWRGKQESEFYFLVLPPLEVLLERDAARTLKLQRPIERAHFAREYVIKTYNTLNNWNKNSFDHCFDSSHESLSDEVAKVRSLTTSKF